MKGLDRYLLRQLGVSVVFVAVALTIAIWLTQSLRYVDYIINRGLSFGTFIYFTTLLMPSLLVVVLPIALFVSVLFVYNRLTVDRETVVMRATGMSHIQLAAPALIVAAVVTVAGYFFNLYLLPVTFRQFKDLEQSFRTDIASVILQERKFNTVGDGLTVYIRKRDPSGELHGILAHDSRNRNKPVTYMAQRGALVESPAGPRVVLVNGNRQMVEPQTGKLTMLYFDRYTVDLNLFRRDKDNTWLEPQERFLSELFWPGNTADDRFYADKLRAEGHQRLASPLLSLSFTLICLAALLSGEFSRRGQARRVVVAVTIVAAVEAASFGIFNSAAKIPWLIPLMYLNAIVPGLIALYVLVRDPRLRRRRPRQDGVAARA